MLELQEGFSLLDVLFAKREMTGLSYLGNVLFLSCPFCFLLSDAPWARTITSYSEDEEINSG